MRLIDKDALKPDVEAWTAEKKFEYRYSPKAIEEAPIIEAIPIKWLKEQAEDTPYQHRVNRLIERWKKEK